MKKEIEKKSTTELLLSLLQEQAQFSLDLASIFLTTRYKGVRLLKAPIEIDGDWAEAHRARKVFHARLADLRKGGLVTQQKTPDGILVRITEKGRDRLEGTSKASRKKVLEQRKKDGKTLIVSYDIPERKSSARKWLRGILKLLDFTMVHKSVWVGIGPVPRELLDELRTREVFESVHIFEVGNQGTIKKITEAV